MQNQNHSQTGILKVCVFDNTVASPMNNAEVIIKEAGDNGEILEKLQTDSSGNTDSVDLSAPDIEFSLEKNDETRPYSLYDVIVKAEGYDETEIKNVQILPERGCIQSVYLQPVKNAEKTSQYDILPHTLWGEYSPKTPETEIKKLPPATGYVVLPEPVIPEYIIVHHGVPTSTGENYYVPFADYIKNVASSEVYSTWPTETLEANILAIISFTLNRVYTEWYRSKGYNFTITDSTAYDQCFVYQRNIFDEISDIVDYLFTTYITKPNIKQPLFTQYCNGKNISCPGWMEQWGSKYLGDKGYDAVQILRQYYGQDIYLSEAKKVEGIPMSYPGTPLQTGSVGSDVRVIQEQLNVISDNYPAIGKLKVDGIFGNETRNAVETFQGIFGLSQTGIVDFATWYKISNIYVAVAKLVA